MFHLYFSLSSDYLHHQCSTSNLVLRRDTSSQLPRGLRLAGIGINRAAPSKWPFAPSGQREDLLASRRTCRAGSFYDLRRNDREEIARRRPCAPSVFTLHNQ